jgi:hypothetical protein
MPLRFDRSSTRPRPDARGARRPRRVRREEAPTRSRHRPRRRGPLVQAARESVPTQAIDEGPDLRALEGEGAEGADLHGWPTGAVAGGPARRRAVPLRQRGADRRGPRDARAARPVAPGEPRRQGDRGRPLRRAGHRGLQPRPRRAAGARGPRLPGRPRGRAGARPRTVSYGKERPLDPGSGEAAWAKNRRAAFAWVASAARPDDACDMMTAHRPRLVPGGFT